MAALQRVGSWPACLTTCARMRPVTALQRLHSRHLGRPAIVGDESDVQEIEACTAELAQLLSRAKARVQAQAAACKSPLEAAARSEEDVLRQNIVKAHAMRVQTLVRSLQATQATYSQRLARRESRSEVAFGSPALPSAGSALEFDLALSTDDRGFTPAQQHALRAAIHDASITRELVEMQRSMAELTELFRDMALLVTEQGTMLDVIENNVTQTSANVASGVGQLQKASSYYARYQKRLCILLLIVVMFVMLLVLMMRL